MKHPEPQIVTVYRAAQAMKAPQVCHTCENYLPDGICAEFDAEPPVDFAETPGSCELWIQEIPL